MHAIRSPHGPQSLILMVAPRLVTAVDAKVRGIKEAAIKGVDVKDITTMATITMAADARVMAETQTLQC